MVLWRYQAKSSKGPCRAQATSTPTRHYMGALKSPGGKGWGCTLAPQLPPHRKEELFFRRLSSISTGHVRSPSKCLSITYCRLSTVLGTGEGKEGQAPREEIQLKFKSKKKKYRGIQKKTSRACLGGDEFSPESRE